MAATIFNWVCLLILAWLPVDFGIQALHQRQQGKVWTPALMIVGAVLLNVFVIISFQAP
jgi:hypothetical protein